MTEDELYNLIIDRIKEAGSQRALAEQVGISEAYLSDYLHDRRLPGPGFLAALGLRKVNTYERNDTGAD